MPFCGNTDIEPSRYDVDVWDDAESVARDGLIRQWNTRWTPSEGDGHGVAH